MKAIFLLTVLLLLSGSSMFLAAQEGALPGHFIVSGSGWTLPGGLIQNFHGQINSNETVDGDGYTPGCLPADLCDPVMGIDLGGLSTPVAGMFDFTANTDGSGNVNFHAENVGPSIYDIKITTILDPAQQALGFQCFPGAFFECGIKIDTIIPNQLDMLWDNPDKSTAIDSAVPEPSGWMLLLTAAGALLLRFKMASPSRS